MVGFIYSQAISPLCSIHFERTQEIVPGNIDLPANDKKCGTLDELMIWYRERRFRPVWILPKHGYVISLPNDFKSETFKNLHCFPLWYFSGEPHLKSYLGNEGFKDVLSFECILSKGLDVELYC